MGKFGKQIQLYLEKIKIVIFFIDVNISIIDYFIFRTACLVHKSAKRK